MNTLIHTEYKSALLLDSDLRKIDKVQYSSSSKNLTSAEVNLVKLEEEYTFHSDITGTKHVMPAGSIVAVTYDGLVHLQDLELYVDTIKARKLKSDATKDGGTVECNTPSGSI